MVFFCLNFLLIVVTAGNPIHENEASKVSRVEGIVRGGKDVVVSLHGRGSFTRFTCLFLE